MISYYNHFTQKFGIPNDRVKKTGNIVYVHLPYLPEALILFSDWGGEDLTFVCEGGDICLHLSNDGLMLLTGNTTQPFKQYKISEINPKIKKIFATNLNFKHPLFSVLPAGHYTKNDLLSSIQKYKTEDKKLILCNFAPHTRGAAGYERKVILDIIKSNPWITFQDQGGGDGKDSKVTLQDLLSEINKHKFLICPISNGYDTSRIWESYALGAIPVVRRFPFFNNLVDAGFPMVVLDNWNDLSGIEEYLKGYPIDEKLRTLFISNLLLEDYWLDKIQDKYV